MILIRRSLAVLGPLALLAALEFLLAQQHLFWYFLPLITFIAVYPIGSIARWQFAHEDFWQFLSLPTLLIASTVALLVFNSNALFGHVLVVATSLLYGWYLQNAFLFLYETEQYQPYALEYISSYLALIITFFSFASFVAARVFLNARIILLLPVATVLTVIIALRFLWKIKISRERGWIVASVYVLIMSELFAAVLYLPTSYFVAGLLMAIPHYVLTNIARYMFRGQLSFGVVRRYVLIGGTFLAVTLLTAPWT